MKSAFSDLFFFLSFLIVKITSGDNDGLVTVESAKYGEFKGVIEGKGLRGVSHADAVDLRRRDNRSFNIIEQYVKIIDNLREKGFQPCFFLYIFLSDSHYADKRFLGIRRRSMKPLMLLKIPGIVNGFLPRFSRAVFATAPG